MKLIIEHYVHGADNATVQCDKRVRVPFVPTEGQAISWPGDEYLYTYPITCVAWRVDLFAFVAKSSANQPSKTSEQLLEGCKAQGWDAVNVVEFLGERV